MQEYWSDASTRNCVWLYQEMQICYSEKFGCNCKCDDNGIPINKIKCLCGIKCWKTNTVFLTRKEAFQHGEHKHGINTQNINWRIWGTTCDGLAAEILSHHTDEFKTKVDWVTDK